MRPVRDTVIIMNKVTLQTKNQPITVKIIPAAPVTLITVVTLAVILVVTLAVIPVAILVATLAAIPMAAMPVVTHNNHFCLSQY